MTALPTVEELESRLHEPLPVRERVRVLNELAGMLHGRDAARGAQLAREAVGLARATGDALGEARALYSLGRNLYAQSDYAGVFETQGQSLAVFRNLGDTHGQARCCDLLGAAHGQLADHARALEMYDAALQGFRECGDLLWQARVVTSIDNIESQRRMAVEDALTGLANRRQLDERLRGLLGDARKSGAVVTVALADIDHFKGINDRFSHAVGDEVLKCVGEILRAHCRLGDLAGRYDGEEFMLVFRNLEMRPAAESCERVRRAVEAWDWRSIHPHLRVTLSLGLASSASFEDPQGLLDAADHWLYEAKHHGRNQVQPVVVAAPA